MLFGFSRNERSRRLIDARSVSKHRVSLMYVVGDWQENIPVFDELSSVQAEDVNHGFAKRAGLPHHIEGSS
jgi:hypothetical protein